MMKNNRLPTEEEWNRIVDEAFLSNQNHCFSENYLHKKAEMQKGFVMKKNVKTPKQHLAATLIASAAVVIAVPAAIFAFSNNSGHSPADDIEETSAEAEITSEAVTEATTEAVTVYSVDFTWLPEGFRRNVDCKEVFSSEGRSSLRYFYINGDDENEMQTYNDMKTSEKENAEGLEELHFEDKDVLITYRTDYSFAPDAPDTFGRVVFIDYKDSNFYLYMFVSNDVTDEELETIIEGMRAAESLYLETSDSTQNDFPSDDLFNDGIPLNSCTRDDLNLYQIGDTIHNEFNMQRYNEDIEIIINDAKSQKSFDGVKDNVTNDFDSLTANTGVFDDGNSVVTLDLTYHNPTDSDLKFGNELLTCFCPFLFSLNKSFDSHLAEQLYYNAITPFAYYSDGLEKTNSFDIPANGSVNVQVSFLVKDENFGDLYVNFTSMGTSADDILDLCSLKPSK